LDVSNSVLDSYESPSLYFHSTTGVDFTPREFTYAAPANTRKIKITFKNPIGIANFDDFSAEVLTKDSSPPSLDFAVYQVDTDNAAVGRGEGIKRHVDIEY
jgi:hypothetical protein